MICFYHQAKKTSILDTKKGYKKSQSKEALFRDGGSNQKNFLWGEGNGYFLKQHARLDTFIFDKMLKKTYLYSH